MDRLATLYQAMGRYAEAEPLFRRGLEIKEKQLGPDHPKVATGLHNLASLYDDMGRYRIVYSSVCTRSRLSSC